MVDNGICVVTLDEGSLSMASPLVHGYRTDRSSPDLPGFGPDEQRECEQILSRLLESGLASCFLAKRGQDYVGILVLSWSFSIGKGFPVTRIEALYTHPAFRKLGVARKLMEHAFDLAQERQATRLQLETDDANRAARALYTSLGFEEIAGKGVYMRFL